MQRVFRWILVLCLAVVGVGCGAEDDTGFPRVTLDAGDGSEAPCLVHGDDGVVYLSWVEPAGDGHQVRFSTWDGSGWAKPRTAVKGENWFVNWADVPQIAALSDGTLAVTWLAMLGEGTYSYGVQSAVSRDGGDTWSEPRLLHADDSETEHGFVSLLPDGDAFLAVWLDGRETSGGHGDGHGSAGAMTLRSARLHPDGTVTQEVRLDDRVCDCCGTDAVRFGKERLVAYRDRTLEEVRDISFVRLGGSIWTAPASVHDDGWEINGCPVNGPALAAHEDQALCVWYTAGGGEPGEVRASLYQAGRFADPIRLDGGAPMGRVDVVAVEGGYLAVWMEGVLDGVEIRGRRVSRSGDLGGFVTLAPTTGNRSAGFPRVAVHEGSLLVVHTADDDGTRVVARAGDLP